MRTILFILLFLTNQCFSQGKANNYSLDLCKNFLGDLYNKNYSKAAVAMDDIVSKAAAKKGISLEKAFVQLNEKLRADFPTGMTSTFISSELTTHENLPAILLIYKVENVQKFSYYFFYVNDASKKIILVTEFDKVKVKRKI